MFLALFSVMVGLVVMSADAAQVCKITATMTHPVASTSMLVTVTKGATTEIAAVPKQYLAQAFDVKYADDSYEDGVFVGKQFPCADPEEPLMAALLRHVYSNLK